MPVVKRDVAVALQVKQGGNVCKTKRITLRR